MVATNNAMNCQGPDSAASFSRNGTEIGAGAYRGQILTTIMATAIYSAVSTRPGIRAAANSLGTDCSAIAAYMTRMMDGGMRMPRLPPAAREPVDRPSP